MKKTTAAIVSLAILLVSICFMGCSKDKNDDFPSGFDFTLELDPSQVNFFGQRAIYGYSKKQMNSYNVAVKINGEQIGLDFYHHALDGDNWFFYGNYIFTVGNVYDVEFTVNGKTVRYDVLIHGTGITSPSVYNPRVATEVAWTVTKYCQQQSIYAYYLIDAEIAANYIYFVSSTTRKHTVPAFSIDEEAALGSAVIFVQNRDYYSKDKIGIISQSYDKINWFQDSPEAEDSR